MLTVSGLSKRWNADGPAVLDGLDVVLAPGTATSIAGSNGAGKTTLLRALAGLVTPDSGTIRLCGLDPGTDRAEFMRRLGLLPAGNTGLYARLNVRQNLEFWARLALMRRNQMSVAIPEVLNLFDLGELAGQRVDRMSMGQRQRVRLALTFLHQPDLVLLDEPCTSLDAEGVGLVRAALDHLRQRGGAAIVCAPDSERERLGLDHDLRLTGGRLQQAACPA